MNETETKVEDVEELVKLIEESGSAEAVMELIRERMHPNGMCGCCGQANPVGSRIHSKGIPACSMLCAYHLLHPEDTASQKHAALSRLRGVPAAEDVAPERPEGLPELRSE